MQAKTTLKLHLTPVRKGNIKAKIMKKCWDARGESGTLIYSDGSASGCVVPVETSVTVSLKS